MTAQESINTLTEKGKALLPVFTELAKWGENHLKEDP